MAQYEYLSTNQISSKYENWRSSMPRDVKKRLEQKFGYDLFNAYLNKLGSEGWEISVAPGNQCAVYLAKRNMEDHHLDPQTKGLRERVRMEYEWEY